MATIRRYKVFIVAVFALMLMSYACQASGINTTGIEGKHHYSHAVVASSSIWGQSFSSNTTEKLTAHSFLLKKLSLENISVHQIIAISVGLISRHNSSVNSPYISESSLLKLICILRI